MGATASDDGMSSVCGPTRSHARPAPPSPTPRPPMSVFEPDEQISDLADEIPEMRGELRRSKRRRGRRIVRTLAVVVPVLLEHWVLLARNLLYTAMTRGRKLVVLVGQRRALERAVASTGGGKEGGPVRRSHLATRLRAALAEGPL